jgi:multidrug resistance efflux pump
MYRNLRLNSIVALFILAACSFVSVSAAEIAALRDQPHGSDSAIIVTGKTAPAPGHIAEIATNVMHPVVRVLVQPGDRVRAGQVLVELDADEPKAEVRAKQALVKQLTASLARLKALPRREERAEAKANLEEAEAAVGASRQIVTRLESLRQHDAVSAREYIMQEMTLRQAEARQRQAQSKLDYLLNYPYEQEIVAAEHELAVAVAEAEAAEHDLEHYTIYAAGDGILTRLDVAPGSVIRPGTKVWGEIVDLSELDVRVELTPGQIHEIDRAQPCRVEHRDFEQDWEARFVFASPAANPETGLVPVVLRISNAGESLLCGLPVTVTFSRSTAKKAAPGESLAAEPTK